MLLVVAWLDLNSRNSRLFRLAKKEGTIQYGNGNSYTSVFPNTRAWEQQDWNKIKKQTKKVRIEAWVWKEAMRARKKKVPTAYHIIIKLQ